MANETPHLIRRVAQLLNAGALYLDRMNHRLGFPFRHGMDDSYASVTLGPL